MLKMTVCTLITALLLGTGADDTSYQTAGRVSYQDQPFVSSESPLKGFSQFVFFPFLHLLPKNEKTKTLQIIEDKLSKIGKVNRITLTPPYDLSIFDKGPSLCYELAPLDTADERSVSMLRASLNLAANVEIFKTRNDCTAYVWSKNCFLQGSMNDDIEASISKTMDQLLQAFTTSYKLANPSQKEKLTFHLFAD